MKKLLTIAMLAICATTFAQQTPTNKTRSDNSFTQVDNYLIGLKRLGVPTSSTDNLDAAGLPQNTVKIIYNTTLKKLRIYDPTADIWKDASPADLSLYYKKTQVDSLFSLCQIRSEKGAMDGFASLDANAKVPTAQLLEAASSVAGIVSVNAQSYSGLKDYLNGIKITAGGLTLVQAPVTSASTYDILTRNGSTGVLEKIPSSTIGAFELLSNKQNSLTVDGTGVKYPTVDATIAGLALKAVDAQVLHKTGSETKSGKLSLTGGYNFQNAASVSDGLATTDGIGYFKIDENGVPTTGFKYDNGIDTTNVGFSLGLGGLNIFNKIGSDPAYGVSLYLNPSAGEGFSQVYLPASGTIATTDDLAVKADIFSPTLTGTPTAPTATAGTNTTQIATTAFVRSAVNVNTLITATGSGAPTLNGVNHYFTYTGTGGGYTMSVPNPTDAANIGKTIVLFNNSSGQTLTFGGGVTPAVIFLDTGAINELEIFSGKAATLYCNGTWWVLISSNSTL